MFKRDRRTSAENRVMNTTFRFHLKDSEYNPVFSEFYNRAGAPTSMHPALSTYHAMLPDGNTLRFFMSTFGEHPSRIQNDTWQQNRTGGIELARYDMRRKKFSMPDDSPLIKLSRQYGVNHPTRLQAISRYQMRTFFNRLQTAVYAAAATDPDFDTYPVYDPENQEGTLWLCQEFAQDTFLRVSLFAQAYNTTLTYAEYKSLYWFQAPYQFLPVAKAHLAGVRDSSEKWDVEHMAQKVANLLIFNNLLTGNVKDLEPLQRLQYSLLTDLYPAHARDERYLRAKAQGLQFRYGTATLV